MPHSCSGLVGAELGSSTAHILDAWKMTDKDVHYALVDLRDIDEGGGARENEGHGGGSEKCWVLRDV